MCGLATLRFGGYLAAAVGLAWVWAEVGIWGGDPIWQEIRAVGIAGVDLAADEYPWLLGATGWHLSALACAGLVTLYWLIVAARGLRHAG